MVPLELKQLVTSLNKVVAFGIARQRLDDAEAVLSAMRVLGPEVAELDLFEALIAMGRFRWNEAMPLLSRLQDTHPELALVPGMLVYCQFATNDATWRHNALAIIKHNPDPLVVAMVRGLLGPNDLTQSEADLQPLGQATPAYARNQVQVETHSPARG